MFLDENLFFFIQTISLGNPASEMLKMTGGEEREKERERDVVICGFHVSVYYTCCVGNVYCSCPANKAH